MDLLIRAKFERHSASLQDPKDTISLTWKLRKTAIALKYFKALKIAADAHYIYRKDRFYGFPRSSYSKEKIVEKINQSIDEINAFHPRLIPERAHREMAQGDLNHLHTYFEKFRGPVLSPAETYENSPKDVRESFDNFNLFIHRYENVCFSEVPAPLLSAKFHATFGLTEKVRRYELADEDYSEFTFAQDFGSWILDYCEVGKPLHDMWRDDDDGIEHEAILPLRYYSADAVVLLGHTITPREDQKKREDFGQWWDQNQARLSGLGFKRNDPKNSVGHIRLAELDTEQPLVRGRSREEIIELLSHYQQLNSIECLVR